ncbi:MAG: hypothetical protein U0797_10985 [Gemmataceae bacterium]
MRDASAPSGDFIYEINSRPASWASRRTWLSLMATPDIPTAAVASRKEEKRAAAVTPRWTTEEL